MISSAIPRNEFKVALACFRLISDLLTSSLALSRLSSRSNSSSGDGTHQNAPSNPVKSIGIGIVDFGYTDINLSRGYIKEIVCCIMLYPQGPE